jgi:hypothetical protein
MSLFVSSARCELAVEDLHYMCCIFLKHLESLMPENQPKSSRRGFFFGAAATSAAALAVTALPKIQEAPALAPEPRPAPEKGGGYTVSEHVKRYYQTTRV